MLADDFARLIAEQPFRSRVPTSQSPIFLDHEDGILLRVGRQEMEAFLQLMRREVVRDDCFHGPVYSRPNRFGSCRLNENRPTGWSQFVLVHPVGLLFNQRRKKSDRRSLSLPTSPAIYHLSAFAAKNNGS